MQRNCNRYRILSEIDFLPRREDRDRCQNIFSIINEHRKKLNEIRNITDLPYNKYYISNGRNKTFDENCKTNKTEDISNYIKNAKEFLNNNKLNSLGFYLKNNFVDESNNNDNSNKEENIINIKLLKSKLENKESEIKRLENNIDLLNKENKQLKEYINKLESNYPIFNNNNNTNDLFCENIINNENTLNDVELKNNEIKELINKDNISTINDNINNSVVNNINNNMDTIMSTINNFIRRIYMTFNDIIEEKEYFYDLNSNQVNELKNHLSKIEKMVKDVVNSNENKNSFEYENLFKGIKTSKPSYNPINYKTGNNFGKIFEKNKIMKKKKSNNSINKFKYRNNNNIKRSKSHEKISVFQRNNSGKLKTRNKFK